jgi:glycosyltransferase involved in cell wall biosynthesis
MRVGFLADGFILWTGGQDVFRQIIQSYLELKSNDQIHIVVPIKGPRYKANYLLKKIRDLVFNTKNKYPTKQLILNYLQEIAAYAEDEFKVSIKIDCIDSGIYSLKRFCEKSKIDILLPSLYPLPKNFPTPWIGYITDFQHKKEPHFFSKKEIVKREKFFKEMLNSARSVLVNSNEVLSDAGFFYGSCFAKIFVLPFNASYPRSHISDEFETIKKYELRKPYFIISNQFWKHKDHETAIRAFAKIASDNEFLLLACTGAKFDPRNPYYMKKVEDLVCTLGVDSRIKLLGLIPKADQLALLKGSVALIQPSRSEGGPGGGATYDAIGLGVRVILSDISVNLELRDYDVKYFKVGNVFSLINSMNIVLGEEQNCVNFEELITKGRSRMKSCGDIIRFSIVSTIEKYNLR